MKTHIETLADPVSKSRRRVRRTLGLRPSWTFASFPGAAVNFDTQAQAEAACEAAGMGCVFRTPPVPVGALQAAYAQEKAELREQDGKRRDLQRCAMNSAARGDA